MMIPIDLETFQMGLLFLRGERRRKAKRHIKWPTSPGTGLNHASNSGKALKGLGIHTAAVEEASH
jgi:hypothetical protein